MHVYLSGYYFQQNKVIIPNNNNAINIYCVYKLDPIAPSRDTTFTIQYALFGAMKITKNATDQLLTDQLVEEKLCIGNLSDQWTTGESEKTGLYGSIYDFVVDYEQIVVVKAI